MAMQSNGSEQQLWSVIAQPGSKPQASTSYSARERRQLCPERLRHGTTPQLQLQEDLAVGDGHRSVANNVSAKQSSSRKAGLLSTYLELITGPFFLEVFSGSGRLAKAVRAHGLQVFEFDLTEQGGRRNLLHPKVLMELRALISHPQCRGVWFGYPCGTFSSARRFDGGPPPLRGTNSKDIWGLPGITWKERARVNSANKLLLRMNELMKLGENCKVPFYLDASRDKKMVTQQVLASCRI